MDLIVYKLARLADYTALSDAEAETKANAATVERRDEVRKDYIALAKIFGSTSKITALDAALKTAGLEWVQRSLGNQGLNMADPLTIAAIDGLRQAGLISLDDANALKAIGIWHVSPYVAEGGVGTCTAEDFAEARAVIALDAVRAFVVGRYNDVIDALDAGTVTTIDAAKAALGA